MKEEMMGVMMERYRVDEERKSENERRTREKVKVKGEQERNRKGSRG